MAFTIGAGKLTKLDGGILETSLAHDTGHLGCGYHRGAIVGCIVVLILRAIVHVVSREDVLPCISLGDVAVVFLSDLLRLLLLNHLPNFVHGIVHHHDDTLYVLN